MKKLWLYTPIRLHSRKREKSWNFEIMNFKMSLEYSNKTLFFEEKLLFQRAVEKLLWTLRTSSMYLKDSFNLVLCVSEKIVILRYTTQIILKEFWKNLGFWKNEAQMCSEYSNKTKHFEAKLLFQRTVKAFCVLYGHVQGIWMGFLTLFFASVKKLCSYDTSIKIYRREKLRGGG